jgi:hypothetical protein
MKKLVAVMVLVLVVALPALAGGKGKCAGSGDDCLKKMQQ